MLKPRSSAPMYRRAHLRAADVLFRARRAEIVAAVVQQAEAGNRAAMRLAGEHGLPVEPAPEVLRARMVESIKRTRATVAALLAEGGLDVGKASRLRRGAPGRVRQATEEAAALVKNNENTSGAGDVDAGG